MSIESLVVGFFAYALFEALVRIGLLIRLVGWRSMTWKLLKPALSMLVSPGYCIARNCKNLVPNLSRRSMKLARLIRDYNCANLLISIVLYLFVMATKNEGFSLLDTTISFIVWRAVSRSFEIAVAFGGDIMQSKSESDLKNNWRMKLAVRSYFEIFIFSATLYAVLIPQFNSFEMSTLASLYVGTFVNVSYVADKLKMPHFVFLQVFSTSSLVLLSIAGYLGSIKKER